MWGPTKIYKQMREMFPTQIDQQIKDLVALARHAYMVERDGDDVVDPHYMDFLFCAASIPLNSNRDAHRSFLASYLKYLLG
jgi:hypothetical protein